MSATGRSDVRQPADFYSTPSFTVHRLLDVVGQVIGSRLLEPSAGNGSIARAVNAWFAEHICEIDWTLIELREKERKALSPLGRVHIGDFLAAAPALRKHQHDGIVGNPPFSLAEEFVEACVDLARSWERPAPTCLLLRTGFLYSEERAPLFEKIGMPDVYLLPNRPTFTGKGSDATDYAWMRWGAQRQDVGKVRRLALTPLIARRAV